MCHSIAHRAPFRVQNRPKPRVAFQLHRKEKGRGNAVTFWLVSFNVSFILLGSPPQSFSKNGVGLTCQWQQPNCGAFSISICFLHGRGAFFNLQPLLPSSNSILVANFIACRLQLQPSSPFNFQTPSLFYFLHVSLMSAVYLMQLLPNELVTQIIIHSIKDEPVFHFLNLRNKICGTFLRICDSEEVLLHVSLRDLCEVCKNRYVKSCFERRFREANHPEALCFKGMERLMRRRNPDKGLKLIGDAATEDSGAKYFLVMLKYRCNPTDPEAMALLQEISGGPSPPDGRWKNHNLQRLCYLIK
jgi:hypothetical protein